MTKAVAAFTNDQAPTDDRTMLILRAGVAAPKVEGSSAYESVAAKPAAKHDASRSRRIVDGIPTLLITGLHHDGAWNLEAFTSAVLTPALSVTIDRTAPAQPGAPDLQSASEMDVSNSDNITKLNNPTFDTTTAIEAGANVELLRGGASVASRTGADSTQLPVTADGPYQITLRQTDVAGNPSTGSAILNIQIDTVAPALTGASVFRFETGLSILYPFSELMNGTFVPTIAARTVPDKCG